MVPAAALAPASSPAAQAGQTAAPAPALAGRPVLAFVANHAGTVTAINTATNIAAKPVKVAFGLSSVAIAPNGRTAYVGNPWASEMGAASDVFPVNTATDKPGKPTATNTVVKVIDTGRNSVAIAITPNAKTVYVADTVAGTVTAIRTATNTALKPIKDPDIPMAIAITP